MKILNFENKPENVAPAIAFVQEALTGYGISSRNPLEDFRYLSELLQYLTVAYPTTSELKIQISRRLGDITVQLFLRGERLDIEKLIAEALEMGSSGAIDAIDAERLRELFINHFQSNNFHFKYSGNVNTLTFMVHRMQHRSMLVLLASLLLGIGFGLGARALLPADAAEFLAEDILLSITNIFVRCIKTMIAPLIFFTISSSISSYTDLGSLGRMGSKITLRYVLNAIIGIVIASALTLLLKPGVGVSLPTIESLLENAGNLVETASGTSVSVKDVIMDIFPNNFLKAFVDSTILQIIFIAFLLGIATTMLNADHRQRLCGFLNTGNALFSKIINIIMNFLPISVFCSMADAMMTMGVETLLVIARWLVVLILAFVTMAAIYMLLIWISTSITPGQYLRQYGETIMATFALGSSSTAMPICLRACEEKLGVSKQVASFSIPIGVSLHCASSCAFYIISLFFLANLYSDVVISPLGNFMVFFSVFVLAIGAPSISGAGPICVAVLLAQINMPMGLITLIIGLDPFVSMFKSACSCIEDSYVTLALAKSENMVDTGSFQ